jgi:hypothetical protein
LIFRRHIWQNLKQKKRPLARTHLVRKPQKVQWLYKKKSEEEKARPKKGRPV